MKPLFFSSLLTAGLLLGLTGCDDNALSLENGSGNAVADDTESSLEWMTDYEEALEASRESGKPVLMNFTGSDWCPPCIQMKNNVLDTADFHEFATDNLVLLELDFPRNKPQEPEVARQNRELAESFRIQGYPTFVVTDEEGNELRRTVGYKRGGPEAFIAWIEDSE